MGPVGSAVNGLWRAVLRRCLCRTRARSTVQVDTYAVDVHFLGFRHPAQLVTPSPRRLVVNDRQARVVGGMDRSAGLPCGNDVVHGVAAATTTAGAGAPVEERASSDQKTATLTWCGRPWRIKGDSGPEFRRMGPGGNAFCVDNAWVDGEGRLRLRVDCVADQWRCAEVVCESVTGYGTYTFTLDSDVSTLEYVQCAK